LTIGFGDYGVAAGGENEEVDKHGRSGGLIGWVVRRLLRVTSVWRWRRGG
jgi:hypothetical protein